MTPTTLVEVIGSRGKAAFDAIIDTGFSGDVCLPVAVAIGLGLELVGQTSIELADGTLKSDLVFEGKVRFLGEQIDVDVYLTNRDEALIGTGLLESCRLTIDFDKNKVKIERKSQRST
jgi:clan AA aspartic protease